MHERRYYEPAQLSLTRRLAGNSLIYGPFVIACVSLLAFFFWQWTTPMLVGIGFVAVATVSALLGGMLLAED